jgi:phenylacetaldehyde dehydrogenase
MSESQVAIQPAVQQFLDRQHGLWIEGRQAASDSEKRLNVFNPATGEVIASTADASVDDVDRAVMSGWRAFVARSWAGKLRRSASGSCSISPIWSNSTARSWQLETLEQGKSINISRAFEVGCTLNWMRYTAGLTTKIAGKTLDLSIPLPQGALSGVDA